MREKEQAREKIRQASLKEFIRNGYRVPTMRMIAQATDIPLSSLYSYYPNRDTIFRDIVEPVFARTAAILEKARRPDFEGAAVATGFVTELAMMIEEIVRLYGDIGLLTLTRNRGTAYEKRVDTIIESVEGIGAAICGDRGNTCLDIDCRAVVHVSATILVEGIVSVFRCYRDYPEGRWAGIVLGRLIEDYYRMVLQIAGD
jgi:AcrR family transcriptional regulator